MDFLVTAVVHLFVFIIAITPFFVLYLISNILGFILYRIVGYRKEVVYDNLRNSFPGQSENELKRIARLSYRNLSDVMVETLKGFSLTRKQVVQRHRFMNPELLDPFLKRGQSFIVTASHYNNWEWGGLSIPLQIDCDVAVFYKPLSNKRMDRVIKKNRERTGIEMVSFYRTAATFKKYEDRQTAYFLVADQSPSNARKSYWVDFLGRETAFLHGPELYAKSYNMPVLYADMKRVKRGYYEIYLSVLVEEPKGLEDGEITRRFAKKLEDVVRKQPENWLWSHKRWKMKKPEKA
ncbi:MAG: lysophospholipid acyltransferase family protein [Chlorobi bacterium]|nr:lysophospholipid acyltransferase family protein [Chlorobiota bacterium]